MKNLLSRVQDLSQKAAHLKAALETAPPKIAALKESVTATASQLGQLRGEIQEALSGLRTEGDASLSRALQEIDNHSPLFSKAGYLLETVESELGLVPRLIVRLRRLDIVPSSAVRTLMAAPGLPACIQAILASMIKAAETAERAGLVTLEFNRLTVTLGISPSMRIAWSSPEPQVSVAPAPTAAPQSAATVAATSSAPAAATAFPSALGQGSFFEPRPRPVVSSPVHAGPPASARPADAPQSPEPASPYPAPAPADLRVPASITSAVHAAADPLARFKRMPNLTKPAGR